jgi:DNA-binding transcriptional ArsR family regulator
MNSEQRLNSLKQHLEKVRCASGAELAKKFSLSLRQLLNYLRGIKALTSYSHRRSFYTLREIAHFDKQHIWKCPRESALFSDLGSLEALVEWHVRNSSAGLTCRELSEITKVRVDPHIRRICKKRGLIRQMFDGEYVYFYQANEKIHQRQLAQRKVSAMADLEMETAIEVDVASLQQDLQIALALLKHPKESSAFIVSMLRKRAYRITKEDLGDFFRRYDVKKNR